MDHYDILIATPGAMLHPQYVRSLVSTLEECNKRGLTFKWLNSYSSLVHHARELTATGGDGYTLNPDHKGPLGDSATYNKIFWIDSDIEWTPKQFFQLYDSDKEVVCGAYLLSDGTTTSVHTQEHLEGIPKNKIIMMNEVTQVQSCGFGFIAIKSGVFERLARPWFAHFSQHIQNSRGEKIADSIGEDISWCIRAYEAGIPIYFDPNVLVNHMKVMKVAWK